MVAENPRYFLRLCISANLDLLWICEFTARCRRLQFPSS